MRRSQDPVSNQEFERDILQGHFVLAGPRLGAGRDFRGVETDDRVTAAEAGADLFVAIRGGSYDGHRALERLEELGYRAAVGEVDPPHGFRLPYYRVPNSRAVLARYAFAAAGHPERSLRFHGITGTNGKSTTVRLLASVLQAAGRSVGWVGTVDRCIAGRTHASAMTTPGAFEIAALASDHLRAGGTDIVLEVSSHALHQERVAGIEFSSAILTSFSRDHFDYHGDAERYLDAKLSLFERLAPGAPAVITDDPVISLDHPRLQKVDALRFGPRGNSVAGSAIDVDLGFDSTRAEIEVLGDRLHVEMRLLGRHNVENVVAASLAARAMGIETSAIERGVALAPRVPGRLDPIELRGAHVFVDYAHTPDALAVVLGSLREMTPKRLVVVFGCGGDRDRGKRPEMGRIARRLADEVVVTSDNPRSEDPHAIVRDIVQGNDGDFHVEVDRTQAIRHALDQLEPGDALLIAGKGHEQTQVIGKKTLPFDDRDVVLRAASIETPRTMGELTP